MIYASRGHRYLVDPRTPDRRVVPLDADLVDGIVSELARLLKVRDDYFRLLVERQPLLDRIQATIEELEQYGSGKEGE